MVSFRVSAGDLLMTIGASFNSPGTLKGYTHLSIGRGVFKKKPAGNYGGAGGYRGSSGLAVLMLNV